MSKILQLLSKVYTVLPTRLSPVLSMVLSTAVFSLSFTPTAQATVLWDNWYTVSLKGAPYSYYNEKVEVLSDRIKIQVNQWFKEGKPGKMVVRSENLGASAKNTQFLEPLLYNFRTTKEGVETSIDGTILNNGKVFSVKIKTGDAEVKTLRAEMLPKLILTSFFPVWVNKNYKRINGVQPIEFAAIVEDQVESTVPVVKGTAYEMREDDFAKKTGTRKLRIEFDRLVAFWWITKNGDALQIQIPSQEQFVKKVDKKTAEDYFL
jgi:hypothetical protein